MGDQAVPRETDERPAESPSQARLVVNGRPAVTLDPFVSSEISLAYPSLRSDMRNETMRVAARKLSEGGWAVFVYPMAEAEHDDLFDSPKNLTGFITPAIRYSYA